MPHANTDALTSSRLEDLNDTARKRSIEILFADLSDPEIPTQSGYCKIRGKDLIVVDQRLSPDRQIEIILNIFRRFDWENVYIASWIREHLENPQPTGFPS
ncbi:MAG: hypothetical protein OEZ51_02520 [Nitrospinota bacterium]|nr:hypothetical protein [Nitrospinota bacterium]